MKGAISAYLRRCHRAVAVMSVSTRTYTHPCECTYKSSRLTQQYVTARLLTLVRPRASVAAAATVRDDITWYNRRAALLVADKDDNSYGILIHMTVQLGTHASQSAAAESRETCEMSIEMSNSTKSQSKSVLSF